MGEVDHSDIQSSLLFFFRSHCRGFWAGVEVRVQVKRTRFRVPDVCLIVGGKPKGRIITEPPFLVVEVLSPDDRAGDMEEKIADYLSFGVNYIWVINPETKRAFIHTSDGMREAKDGVLRTDNPSVELPLSELFS